MAEEVENVDESKAQEDLSAAFEEALKGLETEQVENSEPKATQIDEATNEPVETPEPPKTEEKAKEQEKPKTEEAVKTQQPEKTIEDTPPQNTELTEDQKKVQELQQTVDTIKSMFGGQLPDVEKVQQEQQEPAQQEPPQQEQEFVDPLQRLEQPQKELLDRFNEDYPDVSGALNIHMKAFAERLLNYMASREDDLVGQFNQVLNPLLETQQQFTQSQRDAALQGQGFDLAKIKPELESWADTQPSMLKNAYKQVLSDGNAEDLSQLIKLYNQANGRTEQKPATAQTEQKPKQDPRLDSMVNVTSRRNDMPAEEDPNDFEGAFKEASKKLA